MPRNWPCISKRDGTGIAPSVYLTQAAANAAQRFANRQAYDYLVRALAMVERLPQERQAETRIDLLKQSSAIRRSMGEMAGAKADLENMLATAKARVTAGQRF